MVAEKAKVSLETYRPTRSRTMQRIGRTTSTTTTLTRSRADARQMSCHSSTGSVALTARFEPAELCRNCDYGVADQRQLPAMLYFRPRLGGASHSFDRFSRGRMPPSTVVTTRQRPVGRRMWPMFATTGSCSAGGAFSVCEKSDRELKRSAYYQRPHRALDGQTAYERLIAKMRASSSLAS
jgi:hypothetical protein